MLRTARITWTPTGTQSLFRGIVRQDGVLLSNGCQFFEELGEEDGGEDFGLIHGDGFGFGFLWRSLHRPAFVCKHDNSHSYYELFLQMQRIREKTRGKGQPPPPQHFCLWYRCKSTGGLDQTRLNCGCASKSQHSNIERNLF